MGEIELIDDWWVTVDDYNYGLAKRIIYKNKKDGEKDYGYKYYGYYSSLSNALCALCDRLTRDELKRQSPQDLKSAVKTITESYERISNLLKECLDGR